jgi:ectoine hydroxylase-related dioxygenase (phytanoyl-CoA dioxygenase family)
LRLDSNSGVEISTTFLTLSTALILNAMLPAKIAEQGFAIRDTVFSRDEIAALSQELQLADLPRSRAGIRHAMRLPAVASIATHEWLLAMAREVLGLDATPYRATLFDKSPVSNWLVAWHQDTALPMREKREAAGWGPWSVKDSIHYAHAPAEVLSDVLALRLHLDDSRADNGPLRVLPRTHTLGLLSDEAMATLASEMSAVECLVNRGGVLAMRPLLVHASSKSRSERPRRVLHIEYASKMEIAKGMRLAMA